ncbi:tripartite tricarboxylate transporter TctB family protein [Paracoccus aestuariivivens]|uniref:Tripartite tricarboxylate transporter TctB family protein n=1 Tax=Paracoccus aestuariivivens TaxID=1820333 RepID=A0A6L6JE77_9RHOB|nr:tripartite tricarboxylate transporter TctB family protein [Paracoccus aestuariivivens]MTH78897.1 tripartite tricarboxylate transporter TctB family protein [Paracoccus aestuariivivens]
MTEKPSSVAGLGKVRLSQDRVAGLTLIAVSAFALWASSDLETGTLRFIGPGMMPKLLAALVGVTGTILLVQSFLMSGEAMPRIPLRGPLCVLGGILAFALTVQSVGFAIAAPLLAVIAGLADRDMRWIELLGFAAFMTIGCILVFKVGLSLPIPVLIIPGIIQY